MEPLGFPREARPFGGHVTLGRARSNRGVARIAAALGDADPGELGAWTATEVVLFQSHLGRAGARYEAVARLPLAGRSLPDDA
jgi:2'-5' RNA ligase